MSANPQHDEIMRRLDEQDEHAHQLELRIERLEKERSLFTFMHQPAKKREPQK